LACIIFGASSIEARLNEWISVACEIDGGPRPIAFWSETIQLQKSHSIERKWNLIASVHGEEICNGAEDPFQSYETIVALRNEVIHFKAQFLGRNESPNNRIKGLM
jgi:hypothetical protein